MNNWKYMNKVSFIKYFTDAAVALDIEGNVMHTNAAFTNSFDSDVKTAYGKPITTICKKSFNKDDLSKIELLLKTITKKGKSSPVYVCLNPKGISPIFFNVRKEVLKDGKTTFGTLLVFKDETEVINLNNKVTHIDDAYKSVFDNAAVLINRVDRNGILVQCNPLTVKILGYQQEELIGKSIFKFVHPDSRNKITKALKTIITKGFLLNQIFKFVKKNGEVIDVNINSNALYNDDGTFKSTVCVIDDVTELSNVQSLMLAQKKLQEVVLNELPNGVLAIDSNFNVLMWNNRFADYIGIKSTQIIGKNLFDTIPSLKESGWDKHYKEVLRTGKPFQKMNYVFYRQIGKNKKKQIVWQNANIIPVIKDDKVVLILTILQDATEEQQTLYLLRKSEEKYRKHVSSLSLGVLVHCEGKVVFVNPFIANLVGVPEEKMIGKSVFDFVHPNYQKVVKQRIETIAQKREVQEKSEEKFVLPNGEIIDVEVDATPISYNGKESVQVIFHDITERKKNEQSARLLESVTEQSPSSVIITNISGEIEYVNAAFEKVSGYTLKEVLGKTPRVLKSGQTPVKTYQQMWKTVLSGNTWEGEFINKRKDCSIYTEAETIFPVLDSKGRIAKIVGIKKDISIEKRLWEELKDEKVLTETILSEIPNGVVLLDAAGCVTFANSTFKNWAGTGCECKDKDNWICDGADAENNKCSSCICLQLPNRGMDGKDYIKSFDGNQIFQFTKKHIKISGGKKADLVVFNDVTEKIKITEKLKISDNILNNLSSIVIALNQKVEVYYVSSNCKKIIGYEPDELLHNLWWHKTYTSKNKGIARKKVLLSSSLFTVSSMNEESIQRELLCKDGIVKWFHFVLNRTNDGHVIAIGRDITNQRKLQLQEKATYNIARITNKNILDINFLIKQIYEELQNVLDTEYGYLALYNKDENTISFPFYSEKYKTKKGEKHKYSKRKFSDGITEHIINNKKPLLLLKDTFTEYIKQHNIKYVGIPPLSFIGVPIKADCGVIGVLAVKSYKNNNAFDQTDLKFLTYTSDQVNIIVDRVLSFKQLSQKEQEYRSLFEKNLAGVYIASLDTTLRDCNSAFANILGYVNKEDVIGKKINDIIENDYNQNLVARLRKANGSLFGIETKLQLKNGDVIWIVQNATLIEGIKKDELLVEGTIMDISQRIMAQEIAEKEKLQAKQYQSMLLSSQINPHFIFNSLNSVQFYIMDKNVEPALLYVAEFSDLMRAVLQNSLRKNMTLTEEIKFLTLYLKLEQKRYNNIFDFHFIIEDNIDPDDLLLPPMLLQPYIENTVVHGLGTKPVKGNVWIIFKRKADLVVCKIKDDGIGRDEAMKLKILKSGKNHKSLGMGITAQRLELLNELNNNKFAVKIDDFTDKKGHATGTLITIGFPYKSDDNWDE